MKKLSLFILMSISGLKTAENQIIEQGDYKWIPFHETALENWEPYNNDDIGITCDPDDGPEEGLGVKWIVTCAVDFWPVSWNNQV